MKKVLIMLALIIAGLSLKAQDRTADEAAIKQTLARFGNSWRKADFSDMKDYMTPDVNWVNIVGMHWHNLKEVQFAHQTFVNGMFKGVEAHNVSTAIRFLTKDVALVLFAISHRYFLLARWYRPRLQQKPAIPMTWPQW
jgi:NO-binding membrane sensor protein with MHYT domain